MGEWTEGKPLDMITGAILAGGYNSRMDGFPKGLLPYGSELLIQLQIRELLKICDEILIVANEPEKYLIFVNESIRVITDRYPHKGPLSGMDAAFCEASHDQVWIVGCDMPNISSSAAQRMLDLCIGNDCDAVIPIIYKKTHPLHGIYHTRCADAVSEMLLRGEHRVMGLLDMINTKFVDELFFPEFDAALVFTANMNTPEEYQQSLNALSRISKN